MSVWRYHRGHKKFICTAGGYDYVVSAKRDCFCDWYAHLEGKRWGTVDVLREFYELAAEKAPAEWMAPNDLFSVHNNSRLSQCDHCNAVVLLHNLGICRYCGAKQPEYVRTKFEREAIFKKRYHEFLDAIAPRPPSGLYMVPLSVIGQASMEAERSMERDGIPRLALRSKSPSRPSSR